jgi:hypothetical protein
LDLGTPDNCALCKYPQLLLRDKPRDVEAWKTLKSYADGWESLKPASFTPIKDTTADQIKDQIFPGKWYLNDCHSTFVTSGEGHMLLVAGNQYLGICRILLLSYNPQLPLLGIERSRADREKDVRDVVGKALPPLTVSLQEKIKDQVRLICGITISNRQFVPAMFTAGMAIAMCMF